jgi:CheY-like chemotaxis protein
MTTSSVVCSECGESSEVVEWGFILLARHGWSARLTDERSEPAWRCPACNERYSDAECWTIPVEPARRRLRVLIVDDQALVLRATASMLREFDVVAVESGAEALERLARGSYFDAVLSDVSMPGMDGAELYARLCQQYPRLAERMLLVSGDSYAARRACVKVARREGLPTFPKILDKPVPRNELVRALEELVLSAPGSSGVFGVDEPRQAGRAKAK